MMNTVAEQLPIATQLHDIHLPNIIGLWPIAWGWYLVIFIFLLGVFFSSYFLLKKITKNRRYRKIYQEWKIIRKSIELNQLNLAEISVFIRRVILLKKPRINISALYGEAWIQFLKNEYPTVSLSEDVANFLEQGVYQEKNTAIKSAGFFENLEDWIKNILR